MPFSYIDWQAVKSDLKFCPICGWRLDDHETDEKIRTCVNHPNIFVIEETTVDTISLSGEWCVHVNLNDEPVN